MSEGATLITTQLLFELVDDDKSGEQYWQGETKAVHFSIKKECTATKASQDKVAFPGLYIASDDMDFARDKNSVLQFADVVVDGVVNKKYTIFAVADNEHFAMTKVVPADKSFSTYTLVTAEDMDVKFGAPLVFVQSGRIPSSIRSPEGL